MKKSQFFLIITVIVMAIFAMTGCGKKETVDFATLEDARHQARANGEENAKTYRAENPRFDARFKIVSHGDSTQSPECPQGDGWTTNSIMSVEGKEIEKYTIKCSTVSAALGCYLDADFVKKPFAMEEGKCQDTNKVPFPLPKLSK